MESGYSRASSGITGSTFVAQNVRSRTTYRGLQEDVNDATAYKGNRHKIEDGMDGCWIAWPWLWMF
jgi:hypothetical protein